MEVSNENSQYYLIPYYNAGTLQEIIDQNIFFDEAGISDFIIQISEQLENLYKKQLYHGELCPEHIMLNIEPNK